MTEAMFKVRPRKEFIWYGIDLDDTIAKGVWDPEKPDTWYAVGEPINENVNKLFEVVAAGYKIVIHTARPWDMYELVESWLLVNGIPFHAIVMGKFNCKAFVDDKAVNALEESWLVD